MKTYELQGSALDWAVAKADGVGVFCFDDGIARCLLRDPSRRFNPSTSWREGGPIIERERIGVWHYQQQDWMASWWKDGRQAFGPTPLIAAMRCFVASRLGDTVDIPEELQ